MPVRFRLLGDIEADVDGVPVELGHARQRGVLAALLADANKPVSADQLTDRVWADRAPLRAHRCLASYLSRLRRSLAAAEDVVIAHGPGGYVIRVAADAIDLHRFRALVADARADQALARFDEALELWRGDAFAGADTPWGETMRETLAAERAAAELDRTDLALRLGRHNTVLAGIAARAAASPLDERVAGQLVLALYRAGRQADALEHYERTRRRLADEFGADPGHALRELHRKILTADPGLESPPVTAPPRGTVPRQLPAAPRRLVGRDREAAAVTHALTEPGGTVPVCAIGGPAGVGKTALALRWAHDHLDRFPDGQVHVDLRGFDPSGTPMPAETAVRRLLGALGADPAALPADEDGLVALYRSLVAGKRLLVVLDNARDAAQVAPLLPGSGTCAVLVTSRHRLTGLGVRGAALVELDVLTEAAARDLLAGALGPERVDGEPGAVERLVRWCAGLPLALGIVAARAAARPGFPLEVLAEECHDASARLDALDAGELNANLRAVFSWSCTALDPVAAEAFRLLGVAPGPDLGLTAAAALTGLDAPRVRSVLRCLVDANLLQEPVPGRYRMHDLLRLYATELAGDDVRATGLRRLTDCQLHTARAAARLLRPEHPVIELAPAAGAVVPGFADRAAATAWFDVEHAGLLALLDAAAARGGHRTVWQLAWFLSAYHAGRGLLVEDLTAWQAGVAAARELRDPAALAVAHLQAGTACARVDRHVAAVGHLHQALDLAGAAPDVLADVHRTLGWVWTQRGEHERALPHARRSLELYRADANAMREADALNSVGWLQARLGELPGAADTCERALALCRRLGHRRAEAQTLHSLGFIAQRLGRPAEALGRYEDALDVVRATRDVYDEAVIQLNLGEVYAELGRLREARRAWEEAEQLGVTQHRAVLAETARRRLAGARIPAGR
ncbi:tetratricopeptide repeat protein [Amycolatopsis sp. OK19-0408]|uniref:Tetratricopeptide repeat protein n=1 Tax=Amycolatopsis iheyensis TaxID=2945988 RepID=A0A9X2NKP9_9PSEU|nr:BTAD domain-containing putative transcriptional regulator [Amycolatopsis iheyensis]MCR6489168.1 tetratricopeptide repeat protein [Amycolatopsis iheyensis]